MKKIYLSLLSFILITPAFCQWNNNPSVNNVVANTNDDDYVELAVSDGANGSIVFIGSGSGTNDNIYAQRITSAGIIAWGGTATPVAICETTEEKDDLHAIADGSGGAFVTWTDYRHNPDKGEVYIQRINSAGVVQWGVNGLRVTNTATQDEYQPLLCTDGTGGVIIVWTGDDDVMLNIQAYAQRYNGLGVAQWTAAGVQVATAPGFRGVPSVVSDGSAGVIIFFADTRNDPIGLDYLLLNDQNSDLTNLDIYAQRLNSNGNRLWTNNGVPVSTSAGNQQGYGLAVTDGAGGAIAVFDDDRNDTGNYTNYDVFAQKVNGAGAIQWDVNGVAFSTSTTSQNLNSAVPDGSGGVIAAFYNSNSNSYELYVQRITSGGVVSWTADGLPLTQPADQVWDNTMIADGTGNSIVTYTLHNNSAQTTIVRAQKINSSGVFQWGANGVLICDQSNFGGTPAIVLSDNAGAIISWNDGRNYITSQDDVFASKILANGIIAGTSVSTYVSAANGNWNNAATWVGGIVPPATANVTIRHSVNVNVNASCNSVKVESPGILTVITGTNLTVLH